MPTPESGEPRMPSAAMPGGIALHATAAIARSGHAREGDAHGRYAVMRRHAPIMIAHAMALSAKIMGMFEKTARGRRGMRGAASCLTIADSRRLKDDSPYMGPPEDRPEPLT